MSRPCQNWQFLRRRRRRRMPGRIMRIKMVAMRIVMRRVVMRRRVLRGRVMRRRVVKRRVLRRRVVRVVRRRVVVRRVVRRRVVRMRGLIRVRRVAKAKMARMIVVRITGNHSPLSTPTASGDLVDVETHQRGRSTTPKVVVDGDIQMTSPQNSPPKLHGASRTSGGIFRGHATGNVLNAADFLNTDNDEYIGPVRGQINIYLSEDDPARLSPDSLTAYARLSYDYAAKTPIAPVLERVARRYSPVRR
jgi:hypothetical protein